jgi:hypothetical protein
MESKFNSIDQERNKVHYTKMQHTDNTNQINSTTTQTPISSDSNRENSNSVTYTS